MVVMLRPYRTQVLLGHALLALAAYLAVPVEKASLWPLEIWGGLHIPVWVWPALLGVTGFPLARTRRARVGMLLCQLSVIWLVTVALAAYLAAGWNPVTVLCAVLALHAQWTSVDLKAVAAGSGNG
ncbi:hypothetical protein [Deinococcus sp. 6GRE01]|uniref:hypothetical protein n=2 Tax=unclassified Deinococcus TaxID=2623546 RepID=UPI001E4A6EAF|nr:hypothetical protein [Deinococcus sp. 6GRE01]MCD0158657.1 hypothetical protein [Deinococcus sp. 6GRE01]